MEKIKTIKINKPLPKAIRKAMEEKREWMNKVQSGEINLSNSKGSKRFA
jgi:hypothetical protein